jgi:hypothetical protein
MTFGCCLIRRRRPRLTGFVLPTEQERYVAGMCDAGQQLEYRTYEGFDHVSVVAAPRKISTEFRSSNGIARSHAPVFGNDA